jgi:hypothetical protein
MQRKEVSMGRRPSYEVVPDGDRWVGRLSTAQRKVERAVGERDALVTGALDAGLSLHSVAEAIHVNPATVMRKYARGGKP